MDADLLLSLPPNMSGSLAACDPDLAARCFATFDPPGSQLGSGGGTAYVLDQAGRAAGAKELLDWIGGGTRILIHAGGQSRRLPAYGPSGKLLMPLPALRWAYGQRIDQTLLDLQEPFLHRVAAAVPTGRTLVASGDVLLEGRIDRVPDADVTLLGMWTTPEEASHFGVLFCDRQHPERLIRFLQKPDPVRTRELSRDHFFLIDVGVWVLSERAVRCLLKKCGWQEAEGGFPGGVPDTYDLYGEWALHLGSDPEEPDEEVSALSVAVLPVEQGEFYHFGCNRDMIESAYRLQNKVMDQTRLGAVPTAGQPRQFVLNSIFNARRSAATEWIWIENSHVPDTWTLTTRHVMTGVPDNDWTLRLPPEVCLDWVPVGNDAACLRCYGFVDPFRGPAASPQTRWMGLPLSEWMDRRGISLEQAGIDPGADLQDVPLFPEVGRGAACGAFIQWMIDEQPDSCATLREQWLRSPRRSASDLLRQANLQRLFQQRRELRARALPVMARHGAGSLFYKLDISRTAREFAESGVALVPEEEIDWRGDQMLPVHDSMFRSAVCRLRGEGKAAQLHHDEAFRRLSRLLIEPFEAEAVDPHCAVLADQIVWARSPARVDIAGGWSDTPPYCLEHGGSVFNIALNLNGQPPVQVFVRRSEEHTLTIRSIDLGVREDLSTYDEVGRFQGVGSGFAIARAAFALAGFHPAFNGGRFDSLQKQLRAFGGGVDVSILAALPKGSGMGTSSILAGTLLGALSEFCGLDWGRMEAARRVSAVEQMLGSGGGWQDQYGGLLPGAKLIETRPGLDQQPLVRWAPEGFFDAAIRNGRMLLYFTGITRIAHNVLGEIVQNLFLNQSGTLRCIDAIAANGRRAYDAAQRQDWPAFCGVVRDSWQLNQRLDSGTNPPEVQSVVDRIGNDAAAWKLAGAGGGGYLFLLAEDLDAAARIRQRLSSDPPALNARFIEPEISRSGLQISRS